MPAPMPTSRAANEPTNGLRAQPRPASSPYRPGPMRMIAATTATRTTLYSCPSVQEIRQPCLFVCRGGLHQQAVDQVCQRAGRRERREETQNQQHTREDLGTGRDVGQHVGVLVSDLGQPVLEPVQTGAAPPTERLLQAVPDDQGADRPAQQHQTEILGASAVVCPGSIRVPGTDVGGLRIGRQRLAVARLRVRHRFGIADQAESRLRARLVVGDGGGFEITRVMR